MLQENVEIVRRVFESQIARDAEAIEGFVTADAEWRPVLTAGGELERPVYRGPAGVVQYWTDLDELFEGTEVQVEELVALGPDHVLFGGRITAHGRRSGVPIDERLWGLFELRDRKFFRGTAYRSRDEALEAARLSE